MVPRRAGAGGEVIMAMGRKLGIAGAAVAALGGLYYVYFIESAVPAQGSYPLDLPAARQLAGSLPGAKPAEIRYEKIGAFTMPMAVSVAGSGWGLLDIGVFAYQVRFEDGGTLIIDTAMDADIATRMKATAFDQAAFDRLNQAIDKARLIAVTHEHPDHLGGLNARADLKPLFGALRLNPKQALEPTASGGFDFKPGALDGYKPFDYPGMTAIAPGVVVIAAPGHTFGSQLIYVRLAGGAEYLFLGDVAWRMAGVERVKGRPRATSEAFLTNENRAQVMLQLVTLNALLKAEPALTQVAGHDTPQIERLTAAGLLKAGFAP